MNLALEAFDNYVDLKFNNKFYRDDLRDAQALLYVHK